MAPRETTVCTHNVLLCVVLSASLVLMACDPATSTGPTTWEGTLTSDGTLSGTVAVVSRSDRIEAGINIAGAGPDLV